MRDTLINLLETEFNHNYPVRLQGSLAPDEAYPDSFFTVWNPDTSDGNHYDNAAAWWSHTFTIYFYSTDPGLVLSVISAAIALLRGAGWLVDGKGYDVASDEETHTGRAFDAVYMERPAAQ